MKDGERKPTSFIITMEIETNGIWAFTYKQMAELVRQGTIPSMLYKVDDGVWACRINYN